jgi:integron integrase
MEPKDASSLGSGGPAPLGLLPGRARPLLYTTLVEAFRTLHYSPGTQESYLHWIGRFIRFREAPSPELAEADVGRFLSHLATELHVAAATQNQALAALLFLYGRVLAHPPDRVEGVVRARRPRRLPVVLTPEEVELVLDHLSGVPRLVCFLLYGAGLRLLDALQLRVKDLDFGRAEILIRVGKGDRDRVTVLPKRAFDPLRDQLAEVRLRHEADLARGLGRVKLPTALARKYPGADREWSWQWIFPASWRYIDRRTGVRHRHHLHETVVQKAVREAARRSGLAKWVTPCTRTYSTAAGGVSAAPSTEPGGQGGDPYRGRESLRTRRTASGDPRELPAQKRAPTPMAQRGPERYAERAER